MTIELTAEQERLIDQQLATGQYDDRADVLDKALGLLKRRSELLEQLNADIQEGLDDIEAGRVTRITSPEEAEAFKQEIIRRGKALRGDPSAR